VASYLLQASDLILPASQQALSADQVKLSNLLARCHIWSDLMQASVS